MNMLVKPNTSSATTKANVLIVDDELSMRAVFRDMLEELGLHSFPTRRSSDYRKSVV